MTHLSITAPARLSQSTLLHLPNDLSLHRLDIAADYWDHADQRDELMDGRVLSVFEYASDWTWWELHPVGDELAHLLSGEVELLLEAEGGRRDVIRLTPGESVVIPAATWHSVRRSVPSCILFVTPTPARTQIRPI